MDVFLLKRIQELEEEMAEIRETMLVMRNSLITLGEVERERIELHSKEVRTLQTYMELLQKQNDTLFEMVKKLGMRLGLEDALSLRRIKAIHRPSFEAYLRGIVEGSTNIPRPSL